MGAILRQAKTTFHREWHVRLSDEENAFLSFLWCLLSYARLKDLERNLTQRLNSTRKGLLHNSRDEGVDALTRHIVLHLCMFTREIMGFH